MIIIHIDTFVHEQVGCGLLILLLSTEEGAYQKKQPTKYDSIYKQ